MARLAHKLVEPLLLSDALARARALPKDHAPRARELGAAARRRADAARALRSEEHDVAALRLEREAALLALEALLAARGEPAGAPADAWSHLTALPDPPPGLDAARKLLESDDPLVFDALADPRRARAELAPTLDWLLRLAEPRTERELRRARVGRVAALSAGLGGALWLCLWLFVWPANEAAHKPAHMSSLVRGGTPTENLTDGVRGRPFSTSERQSDAWARVDLLNVVAIERVTIFGAAETSLPLIVELSDDDRKFTQVAQLAGAPVNGRWAAELGKKRGRFVRVRHPGQGVLSLSEIEVWGKR
ncbi:MAG: discoidin domain-containing protein [Myxococcales bacterium]|nr:discoidin domain-containing protein [Myxococcales bacterium]